MEKLEEMIDEITAVTGPLQNFILPGGSGGAAQLHVARKRCRRTNVGFTGLKVDACLELFGYTFSVSCKAWFKLIKVSSTNSYTERHGEGAEVHGENVFLLPNLRDSSM